MAADMLMARGARAYAPLSPTPYFRVRPTSASTTAPSRGDRYRHHPLNPNKDLHKFTVLSVADIFADVIERVHNYKEISSIFFK